MKEALAHWIDIFTRESHHSQFAGSVPVQAHSKLVMEQLYMEKWKSDLLPYVGRFE